MAAEARRGDELLPRTREFFLRERREEARGGGGGAGAGAGGAARAAPERRVCVRVTGSGVRAREDSPRARELMALAPKDVFSIDRADGGSARVELRALRTYHFAAPPDAASHIAACGLGRGEALAAQREGCRSRAQELKEEERQLTHECIALHAHLERLREQVTARREAAAVNPLPEVLAAAPAEAPALAPATDGAPPPAVGVAPAPGTIASQSPARAGPVAKMMAPRTATAGAWAAQTPFGMTTQLQQRQQPVQVQQGPVGGSGWNNTAMGVALTPMSATAAYDVTLQSYTHAGGATVPTDQRMASRVLRQPWRTHLPAPTPAPTLFGPPRYGATPRLDPQQQKPTTSEEASFQSIDQSDAAAHDDAQWHAVIDAATARPYFANARTGETRWDLPAGKSASAQSQAPMPTRAQMHPSVQQTPTATEWLPAVDASTGRRYWYNMAGATRW